LIEEFFDAGIYDFHQLLKPDGNLSTYNKPLWLLDWMQRTIALLNLLNWLQLFQ